MPEAYNTQFDYRVIGVFLRLLKFDENLAAADNVANTLLPSEWDQLWLIASYNQVADIIAHRLAKQYGWQAVPAEWQSFHQKTMKKISVFCDELDSIAAEFARNGIKTVALKNTAIARSFNICLGCCPMGDIDILIPFEKVYKADTLLVKTLGYRRTIGDKGKNVFNPLALGCEYSKIHESGQIILLDLHWGSQRVKWLMGNPINIANKIVLHSNSVTGSDVCIPCPEDLLIECAIHIAKHNFLHGPGVRAILDIDRVVRRYGLIDWADIVSRIRSLGVETSVCVALSLSYELFATPIPKEVLGKIELSQLRKKCILSIINKYGVIAFSSLEKDASHQRKLRYLQYDKPFCCFYNRVAWSLKKFMHLLRIYTGRYNKQSGQTLCGGVIHEYSGWKGMSRNKLQLYTISVNLKRRTINRIFLPYNNYRIYLQDDGNFSYVYLTNDKGFIFTVLCLFQKQHWGDDEDRKIIDFIWNNRNKKLGICHNDEIEIVIDFNNNKAGCKTEFPNPIENKWYQTRNILDKEILEGLF